MPPSPAPVTLPLRHKIGSKVTPGDRLGIASRGKVRLLAGGGCYLRQGQLYASQLGTLGAHRHGDSTTDEGVVSWIVNVNSERGAGLMAMAVSAGPQIGMVVIGRVTRVNRPSHALVDMVAIVPEAKDGSTDQAIVPFPEPFSGTLRQNEIRPKSSLEVEIADCIRPGDVILARVHANGERDFILTTAEAELGVIQAICESSGCEMTPTSWKEMQCPLTKVKEPRKVAKPRQVR
mmetsp:Transcript_31874/g.76118  ORF Transcript_31874/g.76118 Transcript_31874/m.76118 type:complete len:234 (-) Transcript_31874:795-1496(-)